MSTLSAYEDLVACGELRADPDQAAAARRLDALEAELEAKRETPSLLKRLFGREETDAPRGLY
ncbi:MAG: cell division protein ZapE, partial [Pacificimonas sp.]